jgi:hypothetical protein
VGHADFINIREGQGKLQPGAVQIFDHGIDFPAYIARGFGNGKQVFFDHDKILTFPCGGGKYFVLDHRRRIFLWEFRARAADP